MRRGKFIAFEGLDGSGLSTQAEMLRNYLQKRGYEVVLTKEQSNGLIGGLIKSGLKGEWKVSPLALQLLFTADRAQHIEREIMPALEKGKIVISDRYVLSTLAFGSMDIDMDFLKLINSKFIKPDITFIIDTDPEICIERIKKSRFHAELFEDLEKMEKVRENYRKLQNHFPNTFVINGNYNKAKVFETIKRIVDKIL